MRQLLEGSQAVAKTVNLCEVKVVSAYPITPQTHIVENLAALKADGQAGFEFLRAESELAAASIVAGSSLGGVRSYTASSSQGLLLMTEVLFNIAGLRLPVVLTCANRAVGAPLNIWNDQQDSLTMRDSGWVQLYASNNQEAIDLHIVAFAIAENLRLPVMVNMDGFVLTHTMEDVDLPNAALIKKFLPEFKPAADQYLNVKNPRTFGWYASPSHYMQIRQELHDSLLKSKTVIKKILTQYKKIFGHGGSGLVEYIGSPNAKTVVISFGSVISNLKYLLAQQKNKDWAILRINVFRPFPAAEILANLTKAKKIIILEKDISLGGGGILALEIKAAARALPKADISNFIVGLGGRDVTLDTLNKCLTMAIRKKNMTDVFVY